MCSVISTSATGSPNIYEQVAPEDGSTLNQFIVSAVAEKLAALKTATYFAQRAQDGDLDQALILLGRAGGLPPADGNAAA